MKPARRTFLATLAALPLVARQALRVPMRLVTGVRAATVTPKPAAAFVTRSGSVFLFRASEPVRAGQMVAMVDAGTVRPAATGTIGEVVAMPCADGTAWVRIG